MLRNWIIYYVNDSFGPNLILTKHKIKAQSILLKFYGWTAWKSSDALYEPEYFIFYVSCQYQGIEWVNWMCWSLFSFFFLIFPKGNLFVFLTYICKEKWNESQLQINQKHISLFKIDNEDNITGAVKFPVACLLSTLSITSRPFLVFFSLFSYK